MTSPTLLISLIGLFFASILFVGWRTYTGQKASERHENFLIGNRAIPGLWVAVGITMGWFDAIQYSFNTAVGFDHGWGSLPYFCSGPLAFWLLAWAAPRIRQQAAKTKSYMIGNYFGRTFSPRVASLVGICMAIFFTMWLSIQIHIGGNVLAAITGWQPLLTMSAILLVTFTYLVLGGFLATIKTDLAMSLLLLAITLVIGVILTADFPTWLPSITQAKADLPAQGLNWFNMGVLGFVSTLVAGDIWQRLFSNCRSPRKIKPTAGNCANGP